MNNVITQIRDIFRPVLSDRTIVKYYKKGLLIETPISQNQLQPNSVDLTLGRSFKKILANDVKLDLYDTGKYQRVRDRQDFINPSLPMRYESGESDSFHLEPGGFILLASNEVLNIPNGILSFVQGRSSIARIGVQTEQAGLIDAGFRGTITFEIYNETKYPVVLYPGMRVAQVYFFKSQYARKIYGKEKNSKYAGQIEATGSMIHNDPELKDVQR